jgi:hypothetical protein
MADLPIATVIFVASALPMVRRTSNRSVHTFQGTDPEAFRLQGGNNAADISIDRPQDLQLATGRLSPKLRG